MLPDLILQSNTLDILFENRNKKYGAYALRKSYNATIKSSLLFTTFVVLCFIGLILLHHNKEELFVTGTIFIPDADPIPVLPDKPKTPEAPKPISVHKFRQIINSTPVIVEENIQTTQPTVDDIFNNKIGDEKITSNIIADDKIIPPSGNGNTTSAINNSKKTEDDAPVHFAQVMPEFPGGIDALRRFILKNIHQPNDLEAGQKIIVIASFIVSKTGNIESLKILNNGRNDLDKEVLRVINKMPLWKPGMQNGNPVAVYFNLPVTFMAAEE